MTTTVNLTNKKTATLKFMTWYDIEEGWDYASVQARVKGSTNWIYLRGNRTTSKSSYGSDVIVPFGITGSSKGWVNGTFDLSSFAGKEIELKFEYETDKYSFGSGFFVDDIQIVTNNQKSLLDNAEGNSIFTLNGFEKSTGTIYAPHYYLVEWRNQHGVDMSLAHISVLGQNLSYDPGMVVWYVDDFYTDNWTGLHPGKGYLGIVDADQNSVLWDFVDEKTAPMLASARYQMHDSAFSTKDQAVVSINTDSALGRSPIDNYISASNIFDDSKNYLNPEIPSLGRDIPKYGLKIEITNQAADNSSAKLLIKK